MVDNRAMVSKESRMGDSSKFAFTGASGANVPSSNEENVTIVAVELISRELRLLRTGMPAGPLRQHQHADDDDRGNRGGRQRPAQREAAIADRLVEEIADGGAQRSGQDEGGPE